MDDVLKDHNFWLDMLRYEYRNGKVYNSPVYRILIRSLLFLSTGFYKKVYLNKTADELKRKTE